MYGKTMKKSAPGKPKAMKTLTPAKGAGKGTKTKKMGK